ncbi:MAG: FxsA family protein [Thiobacillaceae bacterium]|nr:FxsA family protein [Thiobacillaceae bacterium]
MRAWFLVIIALGVPALELVGIYLIWREIGAWTLIWLAGAALLGIWLLRQEHVAFVPRIAQAVLDGHTPFAVLFASLRRVMAGLLLIFPGAGSDLLAVLLLLWPGRRPPESPPPPRARPPQGEVIDGEFRRMD